MPADPLPAQIILQVILILFNAVFACAEIAVISLNDAMLKRQAESGDKKAIKLVKLTEQPAKFLATIQIGITFAGFLGSAFAADSFSGVLVSWILSTGVNIPIQTLNVIAVIIITVVLSYFTLVLGELVPKRIAMKQSERLAMLLANFIYFLSKVTAPLVSFLTFSTNLVLRLIRINPDDEDEKVTEEEIRFMVDIGSENGTIAIEEKQMIQNIFEFGNKLVEDVMTHRTNLEVLWIGDTLNDWEEAVQECAHSRVLVCDSDIDDVIGTLSIRDFYIALRKGVTSIEQIKSYIKQPYFVPEKIGIDVLLKNMQKYKSHFAVVLDEYGGLSGIVTINDLLEEIVGHLQTDETDEEPDISQLDSNTWKIRGTAMLYEVSSALDISLPSETYDTLSGLILGKLGLIPSDANVPIIEDYGLSIKVEEVKSRRIEWALVCKTS